MTTPVRSLTDNVLRFQYDPTSIARSVLQTLRDARNGDLDIVDATSPFIALMESSVVCTSGFMEKNEANTRKQYPYSAQTLEDLYPHMSDKDHIDCFALPAKARFALHIGKEELLLRMVYDEATKMRKIVIPRNTYITVADTRFSLQYPIELRQQMHGGLQVVYDVSEPSPLQTLSSNVVEMEEVTSSDGVEWLFLAFEMYQFGIISEQGSVNSAVDFLTTINFNDQFYYARVYQGTEDGGWVEMRTTHTDQIYDIRVPTAVLKVVNKQLQVRIPQIYTGTALLNKTIRVDVYETKGPINLVTQDYPKEAFVAKWQTYSKKDNTAFTAPLKAFRQIQPFSIWPISGGANALSFADLQTRVINNAMGAGDKPITPGQLESNMVRAGYGFVTNVDNLTNRALLATRGMPVPTDAKLITAAAATIATIATSVEELLSTGHVIDNGNSITLTPKTLYQSTNGITRPLDKALVEQVLALPPERRATVVSANNFLYTPFHYVLDMTNNEFDLRAYYLDKPEVVSKTFIADNDTTLIQVSTDSYDIVQTPSGYAIRILTASSATYKEIGDDMVHAQLSYVPAGEKDRAYLNGIFAGNTESGERMFVFDLSSNMNVDSKGNLGLEKFLMFSNEPRITGAQLTCEFDILYSVSSVMDLQWRPNVVDTVLGSFFLPLQIAGVSYERLRVRFGHALNTLWARARSVAASAAYMTYEEDVLAYYGADVFQRDENGSAISIDPESGLPITTIIHSKGDPVLDENDEQVYIHRKGDTVYENGEPVLIGNRSMTRHIDIFLIEGAYWFATDPAAVAYRTTMTDTVVGWLVDELESSGKKLLEQTRLYFHPETTLGIVNVAIGDGLTKIINAGQGLKVTLSVPSSVMDDEKLKARLSEITVETISNKFNSTLISISDIQDSLKAVYGGEVHNVQVTGLGGSSNLQMLTMIDPAQRCSIRKRLVVLSDDSLIVQEDVTIKYVEFKTTI